MKFKMNTGFLFSILFSIVFFTSNNSDAAVCEGKYKNYHYLFAHEPLSVEGFISFKGHGTVTLNCKYSSENVFKCTGDDEISMNTWHVYVVEGNVENGFLKLHHTIRGWRDVYVYKNIILQCK